MENLEDLSKNRIVELTFVPKSKYDKTTLEKILDRERTTYNSTKSDNKDIYATSDQIKNKLSSLLKSDTLTINNLKDTLVVLSNGVSFYIPPFSFVGVTEENPNLEITLKSITDHQDLLYENISTVTPRGEALETAGIFYLEAINHKEKSSRLLPKSSLIVFFSSKHDVII